MSKSTVNLDKRIAERDFYAAANIRVSTPAGEGVFHGTTWNRLGGRSTVCANVCFEHQYMVLVPLSDVSIIPPGGVS